MKNKQTPTRESLNFLASDIFKATNEMLAYYGMPTHEFKISTKHGYLATLGGKEEACDRMEVSNDQ